MRNVAAFALACVAALGASKKEMAVSADAVWNPGAQTVESLRKDCGSSGDCLITKMTGTASPAALSFVKALGEAGWLRDFRKVGRVDIAYVQYLSHGDAWLLVNGSKL